jgi:hypothetical protein
VRSAAARAWSIWEGATSFLKLNPPARTSEVRGRRFRGGVRAHRVPLLRQRRLPAHAGLDQLLRDVQGRYDVAKMPDIWPGVIVQGRYDGICPMRSAWDLHRAWPRAERRHRPRRRPLRVRARHPAWCAPAECPMTNSFALSPPKRAALSCAHLNARAASSTNAGKRTSGYKR